MITASDAVKQAITSPVRTIKAKVELYEGSTLVNTFTTSDRLMEFTIETTGDESKFFGFGVSRKLNVHLIDKDRELQTTTSQYFRVAFVVGTETVYPFPDFYITRTNRDENTNELSVTAYDCLYWTSKHQQEEIGEVANPFTIPAYATAAMSTISDDCINYNTVEFKGIIAAEPCLTDSYTVANYSGTETIRDVLDDVAEATQTVYFIHHDTTGDNLVFSRISPSTSENLTIGKDVYFTLDSSDNRRLAKIVHSIGGADNIHAETTQAGTTQVIRDNGFWSLLESSEIATKLDNAIAAVGGLTINQFDLEWRGNYLLEPADKIGLVNKEDEKVYSFLFNDTLTFNGSLSASTSWRYSEEDEELESAPSSLGEALNSATIRIDRIDNEIDFVVSATEEAVVAVEQVEADMAQVSTNLNTINVAIDGISTTSQQTVELVNSLGETIQEIDQKTQTIITPEQMQIAISTAIDENTPNGIVTETGYTFDKDGLTISKTNSELSTTITENGLTIDRNDTTILTVNHNGVDAQNLHATSYLIIGVNSRFEDYDNKQRTGCFWIGA